MSLATFELSYTGADAERSVINMYDVAEALIGFQRSLALTSHLVLNDEIITQAPSLKGANIYALPPEPGSWKMLAVVSVIGAGAYNVLTAPRDTVLGNLVTSAYDYVIKQSLGFHVDFDKSLGEQYETAKKQRPEIHQLKQPRLDALVEKCEVAIKVMHRPISGEGTAESARISSVIKGRRVPLGAPLNMATYEHLAFTTRSPDKECLLGRISSYNSNTFKGRVFIPKFGRPIPFELTGKGKSRKSIRLITTSLSANALHADDTEAGYLYFEGFLNLSKAGAIKGMEIESVSESAP